MTNKKSTKKALFMSAMSLLLCFTMLIGTTFAWFTDSVESLNNKIVAGNLDVELYNALPGNLTDDTKVREGGLFEDITYWEPGVVAYENLTIANEGTLALKYALSVNFDNENTLNGKGLSKKLQVAFVPNGIADGLTREQVIAAADKAGFELMASFAQNGKLLPKEHAHITEIDKTGIPVETVTYAIVIYWEPADDDNDWNANNGQPTSDGEALHIDLGVNLFATQMVAEDDSFDEFYDEDAEYVISAGKSSTYIGAVIDGTVANYGDVTISDSSISQDGNQAFYNEGSAELKDVDLTMTGVNGYISNSRGDESVTVFENVDATSSGGGVNVWQGEAIFKSGTITTNNITSSPRHVFYVAAGGKLTIEEGTFTFSPTNLTRRGSYLCADGAGAVINVYGGTFGKPSTKTAPVQEVNGGEVNIYGGTFAWDPTNWVAEGYQATKVGEQWIVTANGMTPAVDADGLVEALENGENVVLMDDVTIDPANMSNAYGTTGINVKNGQTIDGNGNVLDIHGAGGTWDSGICTSGGLIKDVTVTGSFRGIFIKKDTAHNERVILENVTIEGTTYTISCDSGTGMGLTATNSTFKGWTSYAGTLGDAKFVDCYFGAGNGYSYMRPYAPTEFVGCHFEAGFRMDARAAVTFENCYLDGVLITADNVANLVTSNTANATVK